MLLLPLRLIFLPFTSSYYLEFFFGYGIKYVPFDHLLLLEVTFMYVKGDAFWKGYNV